MRRGPAALLLVALLAGCSTTGGGPVASPSSSGPTTSSPPVVSSSAPPPVTSSPAGDPNAAYGLSVPRWVTLTRLGTSLSVGADATVAWRPTPTTVGVVRLRVTRIRLGSIADLGAFDLDAAARGSTPYYVDALVTNLSRTDLGGVQPPLLLATTTGTLVQPSSFDATFAPCAARPLPAPYPKGATGPVCLVFLAPDHGTLASVTFRPQASYAPITWTGRVRTG